MYDKQRGKKWGFGSDADSDGGQIGFGSSRSKKGIMSDEQVLYHACWTTVVCTCATGFWPVNVLLGTACNLAYTHVSLGIQVVDLPAGQLL